MEERMVGEKSPEMENFLEDFAKEVFGRSRAASGETQTCVICGGEVNYFRDELSAREYRISKMCQKCQDSVFGS